MDLRQLISVLKHSEDFYLRHTQISSLKVLKFFILPCPQYDFLFVKWENGRDNLPENIQKVTAPQSKKDILCGNSNTISTRPNCMQNKEH